MLNERREYRALLTEGYEGLLEKTKGTDLNGVGHAFEILARGMNETLQKVGITPDKDAWYRCMEGFLQVWFEGGFISNKCYEEVVSYDEVFNDFFEADKHNLKAYFEINTDKTFCSLRFSEELKDGTNTRWQLYYSEVIADALHRGPLRNQVLLIKGSDKKELLKDGLKLQRVDRKRIGNPLQAKVLAIVAFYLQNKMKGQRYIGHRLIDIGNYLGMEPYGKGGPVGSVADIINKGYILYTNKDKEGRPQNRSLFRRICLHKEKNNDGKMTVDEKWLEEFGVQLWPADQPIPEGYVAFDDYDLRKSTKEPQNNKNTKKTACKKYETER